jgi:hypothetical protein
MAVRVSRRAAACPMGTGRAGQEMMHAGPATRGPHNSNLGHSIGMAGAGNALNAPSNNDDVSSKAWVVSITRNGSIR